MASQIFTAALFTAASLHRLLLKSMPSTEPRRQSLASALLTDSRTALDAAALQKSRASPTKVRVLQGQVVMSRSPPILDGINSRDVSYLAEPPPPLQTSPRRRKPHNASPRPLVAPPAPPSIAAQILALVEPDSPRRAALLAAPPVIAESPAAEPKTPRPPAPASRAETVAVADRLRRTLAAAGGAPTSFTTPLRSSFAAFTPTPTTPTPTRAA